MKKPIAGFNARPENINRKGAPKRDWTWSGLLEEAMEEQDETGESYKKIIVRRVRSLGAKGDMIAIKELFNRMDGMPRQTTDITSGGKPIPILGGISNVSENNGSV